MSSLPKMWKNWLIIQATNKKKASSHFQKLGKIGNRVLIPTIVKLVIMLPLIALIIAGPSIF